MITLYLFTTFGIFIWGEYPSHLECAEVHVEIATWFDRTGDAKGLYSIECIKVGDIK
mgnify:CR=1 FL=1